MASERDDILSLLLQAKHDYEALLQQNDELTTRCHDMEVQCERQRDRNEGLHKGMLPMEIMSYNSDTMTQAMWLYIDQDISYKTYHCRRSTEHCGICCVLHVYRRAHACLQLWRPSTMALSRRQMPSSAASMQWQGWQRLDRSCWPPLRRCQRLNMRSRASRSGRCGPWIQPESIKHKVRGHAHDRSRACIILAADDVVIILMQPASFISSTDVRRSYMESSPMLCMLPWESW